MSCNYASFLIVLAHATKSRLRLAVNKNAWVGDVKVVRLQERR